MLAEALKSRRKIMDVLFEIWGVANVWFVCFICNEWNNVMPSMLFAVLLSILLCLMVAYLLNLFRCDLVFYFWGLWLFWAMYSFGFSISDFYVRTDVLVRLWALFTALVHAGVLLLSISRNTSGFRLVFIFMLMMALNIVPVRYNNLFMSAKLGASVWPYSRTAASCITAVALNFVYRASEQTLSRETVMRFVCQTSYLFFVHIYAVPVLFLLHILYVLRTEPNVLSFWANFKARILVPLAK